jgi:hypothetical protein
MKTTVVKKEIVILREVVGKLTQLLAGQGLVVTQRGTQAYVRTDPVTLKPLSVNIPNIPDNASDDLILAIQGFIDHEVGHILFTQWTIILSIHDNKKLTALHNIVEDTFVERMIGKKFPGALYNLGRLHEFFLNKLTEPALAKVKGNPELEFRVLLVPLFRAWSGQKVFQDFIDKHVSSPLLKDFMSKMPADVIARIPDLKSSADALEVAQVAYEILTPKEEEEKEPEPSKKKEKKEKSKSKKKEKSEDDGGEGSATEKPEDEEDEGTEGESAEPSEGESGEDDSEDEGENAEIDEDADRDDDGEPEEVPPVSEDDSAEEDGDADGESDDEESGEAEGGSSEETDHDDDSEEESDRDDDGGAGGDPDETDEEDGDSGSKNDDEESETSVEERPRPKSMDRPIEVEDGDTFDGKIAESISEEAIEALGDAEYRIYTRDWDRIEKLKVEDKDYKDAWLTQLDDETLHMVGPMQKDIERMMAAKSHVLKIPGFRSGRLHSAGLHRLKAGDDRVFRRKMIHKSKETAVTLLCDNSGSMAGSDRKGDTTKMHIAMASAYALATTLDRLGIPCEVLGFTTYYERAVHAYYDEIRAEEARIKLRFTRYEPLYIPIYKEFSERMAPQIRKRFAAAENVVAMQQNVDGESIEIAAQRLAQRPEERKVLIVLSDGNPACSSGESHKIDPHCKAAVEKTMKAGIETIGIGVLDTAVRRFYPKHIILNDLKELPALVMGELKRILLS